MLKIFLQVVAYICFSLLTQTDECISLFLPSIHYWGDCTTFSFILVLVIAVPLVIALLLLLVLVNNFTWSFKGKGKKRPFILFFSFPFFFSSNFYFKYCQSQLVKKKESFQNGHESLSRGSSCYCCLKARLFDIASGHGTDGWAQMHSSILYVQYSILNTLCSMLNTQYSILNTMKGGEKDDSSHKRNGHSLLLFFVRVKYVINWFPFRMTGKRWRWLVHTWTIDTIDLNLIKRSEVNCFYRWKSCILLKEKVRGRQVEREKVTH